MPIYEYECKSCGHRYEALQKISDNPLTDCPECKKPELKKLISAAGFRLKGGGWYETDFKSGQKKNLAKDKNDGAPKKSDTAKKPKDKATPKESSASSN